MKVLLLGEFSSFHKYLREGLLQIADVEVDVAADGDGWKKIGGVTVPFPDLTSKKPLDRFKFYRDEIRFISWLKTQKYDVVQLINPKILSIPLNRPLYRAIRPNARCFAMAACGIDYREVEAYYNGKFRYHPYDGEKILLSAFDKKTCKGRINIKNNLWVESHADVIIPTSFEYAVGYTSPNTYPAIPLPVNTDDIPYSENRVHNQVVFFHGLNREGAKGTAFIREALERLSAKYQNEVEIVINSRMPYNEYIQVMRRANVVIDQCRASAYGINGCIAMAQGKVLMAGNTPEMRNTLRIDECPVIHIEPDADQIYSQLEWLVKNKEQVPEIGKQSREFVERYHDYKIVARQFLEAWKATGKLDDVI